MYLQETLHTKNIARAQNIHLLFKTITQKQNKTKDFS